MTRGFKIVPSFPMEVVEWGHSTSSDKDIFSILLHNNTSIADADVQYWKQDDKLFTENQKYITPNKAVIYCA